MAEFGKTTVGGSVESKVANWTFACRFQLTEDGEVTSISLYTRADTVANIKCGIYADVDGKPSTLLGETQVVVVDRTEGWRTFNFPTPLRLTAGYYHLAFISDAKIYYWFDAGVANQMSIDVSSVYPTFNDPFVTEVQYATEISIYGTYTPVAPPVTYTLTITATAGGTTDPAPGSYTYDKDTVVTVTAIADTGYVFNHWELDGVDVGTENPINVTMDADHALHAVFTTTPPPEEQTIVSTDFSTGTIDPFIHEAYLPGASYQVLPPEEDPLGTGEWCVKLHAPDAEPGRSSLSLAHEWLTAGSVTVVMHWMTPFAADLEATDLFYLRNEKTRGGILWLRCYHSKFRVDYLHNGVMVKEYFAPLEANRKYKVEVHVKIGAGDGEIKIYIDDVLVWSKTALNNTASGPISRIEAGIVHGSPGVDVYIYDITYTGIAVQLATVSGKIVDADGNPLPNVGVRLGAEPPPDMPWVMGTYTGNVYTGTDGTFSFEALEAVYPELKLIKLGYGDPTYPVGSITKLYNITVTAPATDLGTITLQPREPIQPTALPTGRFWPIRSITVWPFAKGWGTPAYREQLRIIKEQGLKWNLIDLRLGPDTARWHADVGAAIDVAHEEGFGVMLTLAFNETGDLATIKGLILERLRVAAEHRVERIILGWEVWRDDGTFNAQWSEILAAVRDYIAGVPDWTPEVGHAAARFTYENIFNNEWFKNLDFLVVLQWVRLAPSSKGASVYDPTETDVVRGWSLGAGWWETPQTDLVLFYDKIKQWLGIPIAVNLGGSVADGIHWRPWGHPEGTTVTDLEEHALFYKVAFDVLGRANIDGLAMEHYSFDPSETAVVGNIRGTHAEGFIREGLLAHSVEVPPPPIPPVVFALAPITLALGLFWLEGVMRGGTK